MSNFIVKKIAILGAGVMGTQIAAHCINAGIPALLFDLASPTEPKSGIALRAIGQLAKLNPAPLALADNAAHIQACNYDEHLSLLAQCDLIIEAIAERIDFKHDLYKKITPHIGAHTILASNTSGLSITELASGLNNDIAARFCGVHFFNPPRYMHLVELIPTTQTDATALQNLENFLTSVLGKGVILAKDTPNFVANRIGIFSMLATIKEAEKFNLSYDIVDDLTGTKLGRAKSGTFRTADVVGLDTMVHVINTMQNNLSHDPFHALYEIPAVLTNLIKAGALGQKTGAGFYKKVGREILRFDTSTNNYVAAGEKMDDFIARVLQEKDPTKRMQLLREAKHPQAQFLWAIYRDVFHYIAIHLHAIAHSARDIDFAMRWGFGWKLGPFEIWQSANWAQIATWVQEDIDAGKALCNEPLPTWVFNGDVPKQGGVHTPNGSYDAANHVFVKPTTLPVYQRQVFRASVVGDGSADPITAGETVYEDKSIRLWHQGDDILIASLKTKMHVLDDGVVAGLHQAVNIAQDQFKGMVIYNVDAPQGGAFSAGADLKSMLPLFMSGNIDLIGPRIIALQNMHQALKYATVPVVAAVAGLALGGGCELLMHTAKRVAHIESYIGLVEVGVGLIPAAGGLKEAATRAAQYAKDGDIFPFLKPYFMNAATAKVSKSAHEAQQMGYLCSGDVIVFNAYELLYVAKTQARAMFDAGYRAPLPKMIPVVGTYGIANILAQLVNMRDGGYISDHDYKLASIIADVMCGGQVEAGNIVDEQWILDHERKAFMQLLHDPKTQAKIVKVIQR